MLFSDNFFTIREQVTGEFKDRGSKFEGYLFPVQGEEEAKEIIKKIKKEHHSAAHHCWALVLGAGQTFQKSSDDREPSGTAGKPILRVLISNQLTNVLAVVVRYFGGKLLGVPGLIHAYGSATEMAVQHANIVEKTIFDVYFIACAFERQHELIRILKQFLVKFYPGNHELDSGIIFEVKASQMNEIEKQFSELGFGKVQFLKQISN